MGKPDDEHSLPSTALDARGAAPNAGSGNRCCLGCTRLRKLVTFRCVFVLVLGVAVLLSAVFWLPIFRLGDRKDLDLDYRGHGIVASFLLEKPASSLEKNISQLEGDIFAEMSYASTKVEVISLESTGPNTTKVVFAVDSDLTARSLIRASFVALVTRQSFLHLSSGMFGDPSSFEILKFIGGITVSPEQKAFLMQKVQILFNFTLNFSIDEILNNFDALRSQLKSGLRLAPYENLYISLTNLKGSTVSRLTTVQSQVLLAVGIPSKSRLKQLAQTITGSHGKNLGLNNTVFGRVKQVSLSSILQHSLGGDGSPSPSPSPSPLHQPHFHHHHHHHHHRHHHDTIVTPSVSPSPSRGSHGFVRGRGSPASAPAPVPAPASAKNKAAPPPCPFGYRHRFPWKHHKHSHIAPSVPPGHAPEPAPPQPKPRHFPRPKLSPVPAASPPSVVFTRSHPPSKGVIHARPPDVMPIVSPAPSPSSAGAFSINTWALLLFLLIALLL